MDRGVRRDVEAAAAGFGGVVSRRALVRMGVDRDLVAREVAAGRWAVRGRHTVAVHRGPLPPAAMRWRALWEVGHGVALLDGVSSLLVAGLVGFEEPVVHVSVTRNSRCPRVGGVRIHRVRRLETERSPTGSVPRTAAEVAVVRAAGWAVSDRQAALLLAMSVQQRLVSGPALLRSASAVRTRGRRPFIRAVARDVADGAHSLGELDFAGLCRRYGVPAPSRQVVRRGPHGRIYLDARWDRAGLAVEIDGAGHRWGLAVSADNLRANAVTLQGDRVLRFDLLALRLHEIEVMGQLRRGLGGCV
jgi:hypothetical protein